MSLVTLQSGACSLVAAGGAFVLLDMFGPSWSDLNAFPVEPFLTYVTADPELVRCVILTTCTT